MTAAHGNHLHKRHGLRSHGYDSVVGKGDMDTLLYYDEIPQWQKDNEYLQSGYRPTSGSLLISIKSMLAWHNETINIHSHSFGCLLFALFPAHFYVVFYSRIEGATAIDAAVFVLYFLGVSVCFACSTSCHVVWNMNHKAASFGNKLDFTGIVLLMWGASIASIHFAFICQPRLRLLHWLLTSVSAGGCVAFTFYPRFISPAFRRYRAMMYASLGLFGIVFILHGLYLNGFATESRRLGLEWMILMGFLNLMGAICYATRFPEKWYPYRFDFVGASHQLFHLFVLAAGIAHYKALSNGLIEVRVHDLIC